MSLRTPLALVGTAIRDADGEYVTLFTPGAGEEIITAVNGHAALVAEVARLTAELEIADATLALTRAAEAPWIEEWRAATGQPDSLPDYGGLLLWARQRLAKAEAVVKAAVEWQDCSRSRPSLTYVAETNLLHALNDYRYPVAQPEGDAGEGTR